MTKWSGGNGAARGARMHPGRRSAVAAAALVVGLISTGWVSVPAGAQSGSSVLDGVFTEAQASRGEATFRRVCSACHDPGEFSGGRFRLTWVGQSAADLYDTIATLMPEGDPGSLTPRQYAGVVAYLLQLNGYPAGEADLPASLSALRGLEIVSAP